MLLMTNEAAMWIRNRRRAMRKNQAQLAVMAGLSEPTIRNYERHGLPRAREQFEKTDGLAKALRITISGLERLREGNEPLPTQVLPIEAEVPAPATETPASGKPDLTDKDAKLVSGAMVELGVDVHELVKMAKTYAADISSRGGHRRRPPADPDKKPRK